MSGLLPRDPALPQLAQALDPQAMAQAFGAALSGIQVQSCRVDRVKYRPSRNCSVSYVLTLRDEQRGRDFEQRVAARFCTSGGARLRQLKAVGRATLASTAGPALLHLPALDMLAHWLPNDAKLDALSVLYDEACLRNHCLNKVVAALTAGRGKLVDFGLHLVQYVPEHRACARVELRFQSEHGAAVTSQTLYVKTEAERRGAVTHALMQALHASSAQANGQLRTPQSVLWQETAGLHWQLAAPGIALLDVDPRVGTAMSARVGKQLAALHETTVPASRIWTPEAIHEQPRSVASLLGTVDPAWIPLLTRLVSRLGTGASKLAREPLRTLHGDLHPRNILVDGEQHTFIDLDNAHRGPAVIELGAWVADAIYRVVLDDVDSRRAAPSWQAFLAAYADTSGSPLDASLLAWCTAHNLLCTRAYRCVSNLKPGRFEAVPKLLALADAIAHAGTVDAAMHFAPEPA